MEERRNDVYVPVPEREHGALLWAQSELQTPSPPPPTDLPRPVSAPPDLEMPEPILMASSGIQPNWFAVTDIRADADYELFYDAFKEQTKLPPPLDSSVLRGDFEALRLEQSRVQSQFGSDLHVRTPGERQVPVNHDSKGTIQTALGSQPEQLGVRDYATPFPATSGTILEGKSLGANNELQTEDHKKLIRPNHLGVMSDVGVVAEPQRPITNAGILLRRDDSDASVENLIFRETLKYARHLDRDSSESDLSTTAERRGMGTVPPVAAASGLSEADRRMWQVPLIAGQIAHTSGSVSAQSSMTISGSGLTGRGGSNAVNGGDVRGDFGLAATNSGMTPQTSAESAPRPFTGAMPVTAMVAPPVTMMMLSNDVSGRVQTPRMTGSAPTTTMTSGDESAAMSSWGTTATPIPSVVYNETYFMGEAGAAPPQQSGRQALRRTSLTRSRARREMRNNMQSAYSTAPYPAVPAMNVYPRSNAVTGRINTGNLNQSRHGSHNPAPSGAIIQMHYSAMVDESVPLTAFAGSIAMMARDQHGGRFLQARLDNKNAADIALVFRECLPHYVELMMDPFGNYLCQKLFEHCNPTQRLELIRQSAARLAEVCLNPHGTRVIQRMVELSSDPEHTALIAQAIAPQCLVLMCDVNGNHVIQRCLQKMDPSHQQFIYQTAFAHCQQIAKHRHGCCVLQRCLDHANAEQRAQLCVLVLSRARELMQDPFGNYVVQYVLEMKEPQYVHTIIQHIRGHLWQLSMQKFSSNVVEKVFTLADESDLRLLLHELLEGSRDADAGPLRIGSEQHQRNLRPLLFDPYANYVVQRALSLANTPEFEALREAIEPHLTELRGTPFGKRIQARLSRPGART